MLRKVAFALLFTTSVASASPIMNPLIEIDIYNLAKDDSNKDFARKVHYHVIHKDLDDVMKAWSLSPRQGQNPESWAYVGVSLLHWAFPESEHRWKSKTYFPLVQSVIYQQDSLFDLDRIQYTQGKFGQKEGLFGYVMADTSRPVHALTRSSDELLSAGQPPIGPDNQPIKICTLGRSSSAPYLEMSQTQFDEYSQLTGLDLSRCLYGSIEGSYWKSRRGDFIDAYHDILPSHEPKSSVLYE